MLSLVNENTSDTSDLTVTSNEIVDESENREADERNESPSPALSSFKNHLAKIRMEQKQSPEHETENLFGATDSDYSESPTSGSSYDFSIFFTAEEIEDAPLLLNKKVISEYQVDQHNFFKENKKSHDIGDTKNGQNDNPNGLGSENSTNEMNFKNIASETTPTVSTCNTQETDDVQTNVDVLNIVGKIFKCLKSKDQQFFIEIFDMLTSMLELSKQKK